MKLKYKFINFILIALFTFNTLPFSISFADDFYEDEETINFLNNGLSSEEMKQEFKGLLEDLFAQRNAAIVSGDCELLKGFYDLNIKVSLWAYESEAKKTNYLISWSEKQAVKFRDLKSIVRIRKVAEKEPGLYGVICDVATDFNYFYIDTPDVINHFRLGTNHYLNLKKENDRYIITKEWYTDPFADSLDMKNTKSDEIRNYILTQKQPEFIPNERVTKAIEYAHKYCGVSEDEEFTF